MILETLSLFASTGSGQPVAAAWEWAVKKADEKNDPIQKALISSYFQALEVISRECRRSYDLVERGEMEERLQNIQEDALEILNLMPALPRSLTPTAPNSQEELINRAISPLESQEYWLGEAPWTLYREVRERLLPGMVYRFRHEMRNEPALFPTLIQDMLAALGQDAGDLAEATRRIDTNIDRFVGKQLFREDRPRPRPNYCY